MLFIVHTSYTSYREIIQFIVELPTTKHQTNQTLYSIDDPLYYLFDDNGLRCRVLGFR